MFIGNATHSEKICTAAVEAFKKSVTAELESRLKVKRNLIEQLTTVRAPQVHSTGSASKEFEPLLEQERSRLKSARALLKAKGIKPFAITTNGGLVVSVPPYDVAWTSSFIPQADKNAGTFTADSIDSLGWQAAGLGIFINTSFPMYVRFSADAQFHSRWTDLGLDDNSAAATEGGVGVLVYDGPNVIARNDVLLWSDFQTGKNGKSGDDFTFLTQTAAGQTYFHMDPGSEYLVWVWSWVTASIQGTSALAGANIEATMPFVVVEQES